MSVRDQSPDFTKVILFNWQNRLILRPQAQGWSFWARESVPVESDERGVLRAYGRFVVEPVLLANGDAVALVRIEQDADLAGLLGAGFRVQSYSDVAAAVEAGSSATLHPQEHACLRALYPHLHEVPYLNFKRHDFIFRFRTEHDRNRDAYRIDGDSAALYQSELCSLIKKARRTKENASSEPAELDFGDIHYLIPSHFGFCLGVQNAIERAYETLAQHPDQRVFMLSELIHNPFVNDDLRRRGLLYLQTDKGVAIVDPVSGKDYWATLTNQDIVIVPAFGATIEDKRRLIALGLPLNEYDATCMLVEKVWKAASRFAESGHTVIVHGKAEHEETKATFSHAAKNGPSLVIRDHAEAERLAAVMVEPDPVIKKQLFRYFEARSSSGFCPEIHLDRIALVNQTTLLRNETLGIIDFFTQIFVRKFGPEEGAARVAGRGQGDTLCYATQVNQDALGKALAHGIDYAFVVGGKNSSNTFQLFRVCAEHAGTRAYFIQSEDNIGEGIVHHYIFPQNPKDPKQGIFVDRVFAPDFDERPVRILVTGGASCPDGIIQQVIVKINSQLAGRASICSVREAVDRFAALSPL